MPRGNEIGGSSFGDASRARDAGVDPRYPRLSQQQKYWIRENIERLKSPVAVSDALKTDAE
jgi:hypothetical protein